YLVVGWIRITSRDLPAPLNILWVDRFLLGASYAYVPWRGPKINRRHDSQQHREGPQSSGCIAEKVGVENTGVNLLARCGIAEGAAVRHPGLNNEPTTHD